MKDNILLYKVCISGVKQMKNDLQKLKDKLNILLTEVSLDSPEALSLSREVDKLIVEYYRRNGLN